jgi:hypothetical protein
MGQFAKQTCFLLARLPALLRLLALLEAVRYEGLVTVSTGGRAGWSVIPCRDEYTRFVIIISLVANIYACIYHLQ